MIHIIKLVQGNILDAPENIIVHQVNCKGVMGAGLALQIKSKYPKAFTEYIKLLDWTQEEYRKGYTKQETPFGSVQL